MQGDYAGSFVCSSNSIGSPSLIADNAGAMPHTIACCCPELTDPLPGAIVPSCRYIMLLGFPCQSHSHPPPFTAISHPSLSLCCPSSSSLSLSQPPAPCLAVLSALMTCCPTPACSNSRAQSRTVSAHRRPYRAPGRRYREVGSLVVLCFRIFEGCGMRSFPFGEDFWFGSL